MAVDIGRLDKRVELQRPATTQNAFGEEVATWETLARMWASVEPLSSQELLQADQVQAQVTHKVWVRYRTDVRADMRFVLLPAGLRTFHVVGPPRDRREDHE